jgi:hypothetical protein
MDGDVLLSWRLQNVVFIAAVVVGLIIVVGLAGQVYRRLSSNE